MPVTIKIRNNGAYEVDGDIVLTDHEGNVIPTTAGKKVVLCRCGGSTRKPFCDGTHSRIGFIGASQAVQEVEKPQ